MRSILLAPLLAIVVGGCGPKYTEVPDDAIVHTDRMGYHHAYWHRQMVAADFVRPGLTPSEIIPEGSVLVDLTHPFDSETLYWPTDERGFHLEQVEHGRTKAGYYYESNRYSAPEHGGTHLDAPRHFAQGAPGVDAVPLSRLMAPAVVIDISAKATKNPDAQLERSDIEAFETRNGGIEAGTIVLVYTGWGVRWPDRKRYFGDDRPGHTDALHFPGITEQAANALVSRKVAAVGIDTASIDHGPSRSFAAHRALATAGVPTFENVAQLEMLPVRGAVVVALPMKIAGGSGAPVRIVAFAPRRQQP